MRFITWICSLFGRYIHLWWMILLYLGVLLCVFWLNVCLVVNLCMTNVFNVLILLLHFHIHKCFLREELNVCSFSLKDTKIKYPQINLEPDVVAECNIIKQRAGFYNISPFITKCIKSKNTHTNMCAHTHTTYMVFWFPLSLDWGRVKKCATKKFTLNDLSVGIFFFFSLKKTDYKWHEYHMFASIYNQ